MPFPSIGGPLKWLVSTVGLPFNQLLHGYLVGSLDFSFLVNSGFSNGHTKRYVYFSQRGQQQPTSLYQLMEEEPTAWSFSLLS